MKLYLQVAILFLLAAHCHPAQPSRQRPPAWEGEDLEIMSEVLCSTTRPPDGQTSVCAHAGRTITIPRTHKIYGATENIRFYSRIPEADGLHPEPDYISENTSPPGDFTTSCGLKVHFGAERKIVFSRVAYSKDRRRAAIYYNDMMFVLRRVGTRWRIVKRRFQYEAREDKNGDDMEPREKQWRLSSRENQFANPDKQYAIADATLNKVYQEALSKSSSHVRSKLLTAQRHWISYRDKHAKLLAANQKAEEATTSILTRLTRERTDQLTDVIALLSGSVENEPNAEDLPPIEDSCAREVETQYPECWVPDWNKMVHDERPKWFDPSLQKPLSYYLAHQPSAVDYYATSTEIIWRQLHPQYKATLTTAGLSAGREICGITYDDTQSSVDRESEDGLCSYGVSFVLLWESNVQKHLFSPVTIADCFSEGSSVDMEPVKNDDGIDFLTVIAWHSGNGHWQTASTFICKDGKPVPLDKYPAIARGRKEFCSAGWKLSRGIYFKSMKTYLCALSRSEDEYSQTKTDAYGVIKVESRQDELVLLSAERLSETEFDLLNMDNDLNGRYNALMESPERTTQFKVDLRECQRTWLAIRDSMTELYGTFSRQHSVRAKLSYTATRVDQLEEFFPLWIDKTDEERKQEAAEFKPTPHSIDDSFEEQFVRWTPWW